MMRTSEQRPDISGRAVEAAIENAAEAEGGRLRRV